MRIGIIGLGLIGGSLAGALRAAGHDVVGHDPDARVSDTALYRELVEHVGSREHVATESEVVFLCAPLGPTIEMIPAVATMMAPDGILSDVASVKTHVIAAMNGIDAGPRCIGGHPMAGKAETGVEAADIELFREAPFALVPSRHTDSEAMATLRSLALGIHARPIEVEAEAHDAEVAQTSHLPQLLSSALSLYLNGGRDALLKGPGLRSMLRLAHSDEHMWTDIFMANAEAVSQAANDFTSVLAGVVEEIQATDQASLLHSMRTAREAVA